jgi:putative two-component system response regulator
MTDKAIRPKILVVDDEPANLNLMRQILKEEYELAFAKSGADALANLEKQVPDLILLDVMMPGMDGYEVCKKIKADPRFNHIPVVFCTAMTEEGDEVRGFKLGASDYVTKPVRPAVVLARMKTHIALADQRRAIHKEINIAHADLIDSRLQSLLMLGKAAEFKDNDTGLHVIRMSHYSQMLARASGWNEESCDLLLYAAPMHDIGKISTPDNILKKPGALSPEEMTVMRLHCDAGAEIISQAQSDTPLFNMAREIALGHHEKWDGSGYPKGLSGNEIAISSRIVAIADVFDALTSKRPYKEAWPLDKAFAHLQANAGTHFDPELIEVFLGLKKEIAEVQLRWAEP